MWPAAIIALVVGGPLGACLFLAAGITSVVKLAKVDSQYAARGEMPPSAKLIDKWLDGRKAAGKAPATAKPAKYGAWRYGWHRWQALWEGLAQDHKLRHQADLKARREAFELGETPPPRASRQGERSASWQWVLDNVIAPVGETTADTTPEPAADTAPVSNRPKGPRIACDECGTTLADRNGGYQHPPTACPKAGKANEAATTTPLPSTPAQRPAEDKPRPSDAEVASPASQSPPPASPPPVGQTAVGACGGCGGPTSRLRNTGQVICPACDGVHTKPPPREPCADCSTFGYRILTRPETVVPRNRTTWNVFIHELTGTNICPSRQQIDALNNLRAAEQNRPDTRLQNWLNPETRKPSRGEGHKIHAPAGNGPPAGRDVNNRAAEHMPAAAPNQQGDNMTAPSTTQQSGEVIGLTSAINYASAVAAAHEAHSQGGGETYMASLAQCQVGPITIQSGAAAQEASQIAAAAWRAHEAKLKEQLAAKEVVTEETGSKDFLLAD